MGLGLLPGIQPKGYWLVQRDDLWVFRRGMYENTPLREVAAKHPGYVLFLLEEDKVKEVWERDVMISALKER